MGDAPDLIGDLVNVDIGIVLIWSEYALQTNCLEGIINYNILTIIYSYIPVQKQSYQQKTVISFNWYEHSML